MSGKRLLANLYKVTRTPMKDDIDSEDLPPPEMTPEEKQDMVDTIRRGDIEEFEELLDKPGADINMIWFSENLLMTAVRWKREEMALYLIDNGVDVMFQTTRLQRSEDPNDPKKTVLSWYGVSCRQIAYDNGLQDVVDNIDMVCGIRVMHTITERNKRLWKPKEVREFEKLRATHEVLSDLSSLTAPDLLWEDEGAMADTERTNSTVNSPRDKQGRPQTPSDNTDSARSEKMLSVETRVVMEVQPGRRQSKISNVLAKDNSDSDAMAEKKGRKISSDSVGRNRKISTDSLKKSSLPTKTEADDGSPLTTLREEAGENDGNADAGVKGEADLLPCHSRGACTDDGVYGKRSPFSIPPEQARVKSASYARIGGTRTDVYRKRDAKRKIMLREQNPDCCSGFNRIKPVMINGSYPLESKRWSVQDGERLQPPRDCDTRSSISARENVSASQKIHSNQRSNLFIKPKQSFLNASHPGSKYTRHGDNWDTFPSIGTKTTRLSQTYMIDVGCRKGWDKK